MQRPQSILWFERTYLGSVALGLLNSALNWSLVEEQLAATPNSALLPSWFVPVTMAISIGINLLLWYFIARRGSVVAKWILVVLFAIGILGVVSMAVGGTTPPTFNVVAVIALVLQVVAVVMLFRPDTKPWFGGNKQDLDKTFP